MEKTYIGMDKHAAVKAASQMVGGGLVGSIEPQVPEVQRALNDLTQSNARLRSLIDELHNKLTPVLAPMNEAGCGRPTPSYDSLVGAQIGGLVDDVDSLSDYVVSMLTRLRV